MVAGNEGGKSDYAKRHNRVICHMKVISLSREVDIFVSGSMIIFE